MCCIFKCFGWLVDMILRAWTFVMSLCICSAVCCMLLVASTAGIALGYNYSLAEYIELGEANVSVHIDVADDKEWKRRGLLPEAGHIKAENYMASDSGELILGAGRRMDDPVFLGDSQRENDDSPMTTTTINQEEPLAITKDPSLDKKPLSSPLNRMKVVQDQVNANQAAGFDVNAVPSAERRANMLDTPYIRDSILRQHAKEVFRQLTDDTHRRKQPAIVNPEHDESVNKFITRKRAYEATLTTMSAMWPTRFRVDLKVHKENLNGKISNKSGSSGSKALQARPESMKSTRKTYKSTTSTTTWLTFRLDSEDDKEKFDSGIDTLIINESYDNIDGIPMRKKREAIFESKYVTPRRKSVHYPSYS